MSLANIRSALTKSLMPPKSGVYDTPMTRAFLADCAAEKASGTTCIPFPVPKRSPQLARERADDPPEQRHALAH